jgi:hypothetical protein
MNRRGTRAAEGVAVTAQRSTKLHLKCPFKGTSPYVGIKNRDLARLLAAFIPARLFDVYKLPTRVDEKPEARLMWLKTMVGPSRRLELC